MPNPSFEDTLICPTNLSEISYSENWFSSGNTPDYFNNCSNGSVGLPVNFFGTQLSLIGNGYSGLYIYETTSNYREFIGVQLISPLVVGVKYYVSAFINRADNHICSTNNFGFRFFMNNAYNASNPAPIDNFSHINSSMIVSDSVEWTKITGEFIADSSYQFLILGNFYDDLNTNSNCIGVDAAYYYLDNVCVSADSLTCYVLNETKEILSKNLLIYPNPANDKIYLKNLPFNSKISVMNFSGVTVINEMLLGQAQELNISSLENGIYFVSINNEYFYKFLILTPH